MFAKVRLKYGWNVIKDYNYPDITSDALFHLDKKYRGYEGEVYAFIPDTSRNADRKQLLIAIIITAAIAAGGHVPDNQAANKANYNKGIDKWISLYNAVVIAATERENYPVVLYFTFGFLSEVGIVFQYIPIENELIREKNANKPRAYFGTAITRMTFDGDKLPTLGITEMNIILEKHSPIPGLKFKLKQEYKKVIKTPYLMRFCDELDICNNAKGAWKKLLN